MSFKDYSETPSANTALGDGTYVGPNMLRNKVRPALQQIMADGKELADITQPAGSPSDRIGKYLSWGAGGNAVAVAGPGGADDTLRVDLASVAGGDMIGTSGDSSVQADIDELRAKPLIYELAGARAGYYYSDVQVWFGSGLQLNSSRPLVVASRAIAGDGDSHHCFSDSSEYEIGGTFPADGGAYNSFDARVTITGADYADHYAAFQVGFNMSASGRVEKVYHFVTGHTQSDGDIGIAYGLYYDNPLLTGGASLSQATGIYMHNSIPESYGGGFYNYAIYSAGLSRAVILGQTQVGKLFVADSVADASADIHVRRANGTEVTLRMQQLGQNNWDFKIPASSIELTLGDVSGEKFRWTNAGNFLIGGTAEPADAAKAIVIANGTAPSANVAGGTLYVEGGALKFRGSSGTVTTLAPA